MVRLGSFGSRQNSRCARPLLSRNLDPQRVLSSWNQRSSNIKPSTNMSSTNDIFQKLLGRKEVNQLTPEMDAQIDRESAWQAVAEWFGGQARDASAKLKTIAKKQEEQVGCELVDHTEEFLEPLFPEFNSFEDFVSKDAAYVSWTGAMMTAQQLSMAYKHAWDWIKPHFDGSEAVPISSLWVVELENCGECKAKGKEKLQVYGLKLVIPERESRDEVMTPKLYCFCKKGEELKVLTPGGIRKGIQCGCGVEGRFAMLGNHSEVNAKFISPQGMLELAHGGKENDIAEMSQDKAISMRFPMHNTHSRPEYPDYGPVKVVPQRGSWPIDSHRQMFGLLRTQARIAGGPYFDYFLKMQEKEWKEEGGILVPHVEGHSAYFVKLASELEIRKLLECGGRLASVTGGMKYWARRSEMHRSLPRYKRLVCNDEVEEIDFSSYTDEYNIEEESRTISFWTNFALVSKLLVEQIMSLRRSEGEKDKKLLEESQTKESMAIREERARLGEERLEMVRERARMQQKRHAAEELQGIFGEAGELMKRAGIAMKKQKTVGK